ncbi:MAG: tRNA (adenosine(37)-N6)-threonylcarbamoyltransferase complex ATPase subunit type 1 TsaE [Verrucomicrobiota bacterium]
MDTIISKSPEQTIEVGIRLAEGLRSGDVLALCGDLGAGKTHFTKGVVRGLGGDPEEVCSPTFTLVHEYRGGRLPVFHFDLYRLESARELSGVGWEDYLDEDGVMVVEWAEKFEERLPAGTRFVRFTIGDGEERTLEISL